MMKEQIEAKFGCSIEKKMEEYLRMILDIGPNEAEYDSPFSILTHDERVFVEEYMKNKAA